MQEVRKKNFYSIEPSIIDGHRNRHSKKNYKPRICSNSLALVFIRLGLIEPRSIFSICEATRGTIAAFSDPKDKKRCCHLVASK